jgi:hypothetical protein
MDRNSSLGEIWDRRREESQKKPKHRQRGHRKISVRRPKGERSKRARQTRRTAPGCKIPFPFSVAE